MCVLSSCVGAIWPLALEKRNQRAEACVGLFLEVDEHAALRYLVEKRKHGYGLAGVLL